MTRKASIRQLLLMVLSYLAIYGGKSTAMADIGPLVVDNPTGVEFIACMQYGNSGTRSMECAAIPPNIVTRLDPKSDKFALSFAYNSSRDSSGRPVNCSSGDYPEGSCTLVEFVGNDVSIDTQNGYNVPVKVAFESNGCACSAISCDIPRSEWPKELKIPDESGLPIACRGGTRLLSCQDYTSPSSDFPSSVSTSCSCENVIRKVTPSLPK